ncbi:hypothetical protein BMS3Bbin04_00384 [bacterium BMS3Bbin04]|nr:hypothetical protein BMS3Bbin04_00384 [bacterium BMS3Bbin04]
MWPGGCLIKIIDDFNLHIVSIRRCDKVSAHRLPTSRVVGIVKFSLQPDAEFVIHLDVHPDVAIITVVNEYFCSNFYVRINTEVLDQARLVSCVIRE